MAFEKKLPATFEEQRDAMRNRYKPMPVRRLEEIDALTGLLQSSDLERLKKLREKHKAIAKVENIEKLTKYENFIINGEDIYLYILAKYNSSTRATKVASIFCGEEITTHDIKQWMEQDPEFRRKRVESVEEFRDGIREEIARRALYGVDKPVFDKDGNHIRDIKEKNDKLLEKMLTANCEEYRERREIMGNAGGNVVFNVINFADETSIEDDDAYGAEERGETLRTSCNFIEGKVITEEQTDDGGKSAG